MPFSDPEKRKGYHAEYNKEYLEKEGNREKAQARSVAWGKNNPEKRRAIVKKYHNSHPEKAKSYTLKRAGWTLEQYKEAQAQQDGKCAVCDSVEKLYADHNHKTGLRRRLLCFTCNTGIGSLKDDPSILRKAADYLENQLYMEKASLEVAAMLCGLNLTQEVTCLA